MAKDNTTYHSKFGVAGSEMLQGAFSPLFETDKNACHVVTCISRDVIALKSDIESTNIARSSRVTKRGKHSYQSVSLRVTSK